MAKHENDPRRCGSTEILFSLLLVAAVGLLGSGATAADTPEAQANDTNAASLLQEPASRLESWSPPAFARPAICGTVVWRGVAGTGLWSDQQSWIGGRIPGACDTVLLGPGTTESVVDQEFAGAVAGLELAHGFQGVLTLARDLKVDGRLVLNDGKLDQGDHSLAVVAFAQGGGVFSGGRAPLWIEEEAVVVGGILVSPGALMRCRNLQILRPGVVRLGLRGKLELAGDGEPLRGDGLLDTSTNVPNSVECTGGALRSDLATAAPLKAFPDLAQVGTALPLLQDEDQVFVGLMDSADGHLYLGTRTVPGYVIKIRLSDFTRVGALALPHSIRARSDDSDDYVIGLCSKAQ